MPSERTAQLQAMLAERPGDKHLRFALAMESKREGDAMNALQALKALTEDHPQYIPPYYQLALLLAEMDRSREALDACEVGVLQCLVTGDRKARTELIALKNAVENA